ncbi:MAG: glycosyltransferase family 4 protein [Planctomycetota bacterium]
MSLRLALVLNPFTLKRKGGEHAPSIAREMLGRGYAVRVFGDVAGDIPQSALESNAEGSAAPLERAGMGAFAPDVVIAYDGLSPAAWRGARAARSLGVPLILVEEGFPDHGQPVERSLRMFGARAWGRLVRRTARRVIALDPVAQSQAVREGFDPDIVSVLPSGVDVETFRPGLSSEVLRRHHVRGMVLLHIGRIEPGRGIDVLMDAFARSVGQRHDWSLVFCGTGSYRQAARAHAERLGIGANVHWAGVPRPEELPGLVGSATALLVPALDDDVASLKIRRAMACGVPVLISDVSRLAGTIDHDENGLIVPRGDLEAWRAAISRLASDPSRRERWGKSAREVAISRFSWPRVVDRVEDLVVHEVALHRAAEETQRDEEELRGEDLAPSEG